MKKPTKNTTKTNKRKRLVVANWKMNLIPSEAASFSRGLVSAVSSNNQAEIVICPSYINIPAVAQILRNSSIGVGAQNMHADEKGAYTGEVSPLMLEGLARYVILGHSERRHIFGERDAIIAQKVFSAVHHNLTPILAVGETYVERAGGYAVSTVLHQLQAGLAELTAKEVEGIAIAYEPVWAIGTGNSCKPRDAEEMTEKIRELIRSLYGHDAADDVRVLYGGSVTSSNIEEFLALPDIDGALVGGASIHLEEWIKISKESGATVLKEKKIVSKKSGGKR